MRFCTVARNSRKGMGILVCVLFLTILHVSALCIRLGLFGFGLLLSYPTITPETLRCTLVHG